MEIKYEVLLGYVIDGLELDEFNNIDDYVLCKILEFSYDEYARIVKMRTLKKVKYYTDTVGFNDYGKWQAFMTLLLSGMPITMAMNYIKPVFKIDVSILVKYVADNELPPFPNITESNLLDSIEIIKVIKKSLDEYNA